MRSINTRLGLIPEWVVDELDIKGERRKVGNAYILSEKELSQIEGEFFALKVFNLGGIPIDYNEARVLLSGEKEPYLFDEPEKEVEVDEDTTEEEVTKENTIEEDIEEEIPAEITDKEVEE